MAAVVQSNGISCNGVSGKVESAPGLLFAVEVEDDEDDEDSSLFFMSSVCSEAAASFMKKSRPKSS